MVIISERRKPAKPGRYSNTQLRYAMAYVVITFLVLLFLNVYCSQVSMKLFYSNKESAMLEKSQLTANEIGNLDVLNTTAIEETIDRIGSLSFTRLVVTDANGKIIYDSHGQTGYALFPQIVTALSSQDVFSWHYYDGVMRSVSATPIYQYESVSGCVYMMEFDTEQGQLMQSLQHNIFMISLVLEIGLLIFALLYASRFSRRLKKIMASMQIIQEGNYTHKVRLGGRDELHVLGEEFNDLTERLNTSENKRRQFVSDASHELKTPLASIKLLSDSILQNDMDMETTREFVADIGSEADRLTRMTQKLLALTKNENRDEEMDAEINYMAPTVERVVKMLSGIASADNISIHTELQPDSAVLIPEDDLYQIVFNLVENGIKYNTPGGSLHISLHKNQDMAALRVADTGVGIPPEAVGHVFERFYRVDKARSRQSGGSGLGLAIVRSIIERNNGEITLQSTVGRGTVFTVEFPCFDFDEEVTAI